jgi:hypothetical protein
MGVGTSAGKALSFLERHLVRFGRLNPWVGVGLAGAVIGGVIYRNRREEKRIHQVVRETFADEIREQDLWNDVRSQVAGAAEDLYRTFQVYREGDPQPILQRAHECTPLEGEFVVPADEPDVAQAHDLVCRAVENLTRSRVSELAVFRETGADPAKGLLAELRKVQARLGKARAGRVKKPDCPGMQEELLGFLEGNIQPVLSELSYSVGQGTVRIRDEIRKGGRTKRKD